MGKMLAGTVMFLLIAMSPAAAQEIAAGSRITVTSDWHSKNGGPYSPEIVSCSSNSGLCLRDTNTSPANNPMTKTKNSLQVVFKDFGVVYLFRSGGKGTFHDMNGKQTGKFRWTQ
ncbi:hypothetical protein [Pukyongiella litopenaei]|uniref:Uncharacterized protein n=1 Tax=Pukyongiella litopenaei TaxID=2605946 RepID=A0A2S0MN70_9RHOB|nr:hypothetical protein [Pukyongiella litopenaei]AVO37342.2 hypothetical protein C6Y53_06210 [Pukyongiella litopenaei]